MAQITYQPPSPKAGTSEHVSRETANALIAAGFAVEIIPPPLAPPKPHFGVIYGFKNGGATLQATCEICHRTTTSLVRPSAKSSQINSSNFYACTSEARRLPSRCSRNTKMLGDIKSLPHRARVARFPKTLPTIAPHWVEQNGAIVPTPAPKGWKKWERG